MHRTNGLCHCCIHCRSLLSLRDSTCGLVGRLCCRTLLWHSHAPSGWLSVLHGQCSHCLSLSLLLSCLAMMLLEQGLLMLWGQLTLLLKQEWVSCALLSPEIRSVHRTRCLLENRLRCNTRLGPVDVSKSTAYAALRHVTLCIRPHVRRTCPE